MSKKQPVVNAKELIMVLEKKDFGSFVKVEVMPYMQIMKEQKLLFLIMAKKISGKDF
jgi:hypothetical protein